MSGFRWYLRSSIVWPAMENALSGEVLAADSTQRLGDTAQSWPHNRLLLTINRSSSISEFKLNIVEFGSVVHFELSVEHWKVNFSAFGLTYCTLSRGKLTTVTTVPIPTVFPYAASQFPWYYHNLCPHNRGFTLVIADCHCLHSHSAL